MTLLTTTELQEHVETDLASSALQRLLDSAEDRIVNAAGANPVDTNGNPVTVTEHHVIDPGFHSGKNRRVYTHRAIVSVVAVRERDTYADSSVSLAADDYELVGRRELVRLRDGTNPRLMWAPIVEVDYNPVDDLALRKRVQIDLVKYELNWQGFTSENVGDFSASYMDPAKVAEIMAPLVGSQNRMPVA